MPEAATAKTQTVNTQQPAPAQTTAERFAKIENPQTIKDYYVNNLLAASERIGKEYNGTNGQKFDLIGVLAEQALNSKENNGFAFFDKKFDAAFEKGLSEKGPDAAKKVAEVKLLKLLPEIHNFPEDKKVAAEFTAIITTSLNDAIETRATELGFNKASVVANAAQKEKELAETGAGRK